MATGFYGTNVPTLNISGGTVTNADPFAGSAGSGTINNALNNVNLNNGVLTATTGQQEPVGPGYGAWNINGVVTSTGNSLISTSDPVYGTVMLSNGGVSSGTTTINVTNGTLTVSAPLVQDDADHNVSGLLKSGTGTMVLSGSDTYTGGTIVTAGTVILTSDAAIADGTSLTVGNPTAFSLAPVAPGAEASVSGAPAVAVVPEPGTLALLAGFAASAAAFRRLRRRSLPRD